MNKASTASTYQPSPEPSAAHYLRPGSLQLPSLPPLSLYIHLPWCLRKCPYCDFNSHALALSPSATHNQTSSIPIHNHSSNIAFTPATSPSRTTRANTPLSHTSQLDSVLENAYIEALTQDLSAALALIWGRPVHSIFIGGGTPSLFSPAAMERLLSTVRALLPLEAGAEITLEANPGTFEKDRFKAFHAAGVNRLSIGVQSFDDAKLKALGRVHDSAQAKAAIREAAAIFERWNLDLMYALPQQSMVELDVDLQTALSFTPPHLSIYHLSLEPNTYFAKYPPTLPSEDEAYAMLDLISERTAMAGLRRYEVSAFAMPGKNCVHNTNYWQFGDYLGIGAGAHSKLSFPHRIVRQTRFREPRKYMEQAAAGKAISQSQEVPRQDLALEFMMNALRLSDGFKLQDFCDRTGLSLSSIAKPLHTAEAKGWIRRDLQHVQPTEQGFNFLNDLLGLFIP